jgi:hypothetical protein
VAKLFHPVRENYLLSVVSKYYVPYQSDGRIGLSAAYSVKQPPISFVFSIDHEITVAKLKYH